MVTGLLLYNNENNILCAVFNLKKEDESRVKTLRIDCAFVSLITSLPSVDLSADTTSRLSPSLNHCS